MLVGMSAALKPRLYSLMDRQFLPKICKPSIQPRPTIRPCMHLSSREHSKDMEMYDFLEIGICARVIHRVSNLLDSISRRGLSLAPHS